MSSSDKLEQLGEASQSFLTALYETILKDEPDGNIFFSPFSISLALSMALVGARENTLQQMKKTLFYDSLEDNQIHESFKTLLRELTDDTGENLASVRIANGLFVQNDFQLLQPFINTVQDMYNAVSKNMDFKNNPEDSVLQLNNWVEETTEGKIPELFHDIDPKTVLVIVNAIYFKGLWVNKFDPKLTKLAPFYLNENDKVQVNMMFLEGNFRYCVSEDADCEVLELPYLGCVSKDADCEDADCEDADCEDADCEELGSPYRQEKTSLLIFLPKEVNGLSKIESIISPEFIKDCVGKFTLPLPLDLELPSFKLEQSYSLASTLKSMGMTDLFVPGTANLQGISRDEDLYVSEVIHKSVINVNEEGTEASAGTGCYVLSGPKCFKVDHPFLFTIIDTSSTSVLFIGSLKKPETV